MRVVVTKHLVTFFKQYLCFVSRHSSEQRNYLLKYSKLISDGVVTAEDIKQLPKEQLKTLARNFGFSARPRR